MAIKLMVSNVCRNFDDKASLGTKILEQNRQNFLQALIGAISAHDFQQEKVPGQGTISLPETVLDMVSSGVGRRSSNPNDYILVLNRGRVNAYLDRSLAERATDVKVIVYTLKAYEADPDVQQDTEEFGRLKEFNPTHILVTVLASAGPESPLTPIRFVENLAGGNREALLWTADEIREKAKEIAEYDREWAVVYG